MRAGGLPGSPRLWLAIAAAGAAAAAAALVPPPAVVADPEGGPSTFAALTSAAIVGLLVVPFVVWRGARRPALCLAVSGLALTLGVGSYYGAQYAQRTCTARYGDRRVVIGGQLTPLGSAYRQANPQLSSDDLLFDAAGVPERIWTAASIGRCRALVSGGYFLWIPFLVAALATGAQGTPLAILTPLRRRRPPEPSTAVTIATRYDVFISYRHNEVDTDFARQLLAALEARGYHVAIDERDFPANASFLQEMERCIRESRFTVAVISAAYLESGNCEEEAIVCKVLDMGDRKRRLIPFVIEPVARPAWLYGIVGVDGTKADPLVDPFDQLTATLGPPMRTLNRSGTTATAG